MSSDNTLKKIHDPAVIHGLIINAKEAGHEVMIWRIVGGSKLVASVRIEAYRKLRNDFSIAPLPGHENMVQDLIGASETIDLFIPESALLFRCQIRQTDAPVRYYLQIPDLAAQVDRRKNLRMKPDGQEKVGLAFGKSVQVPKPMSQHFHKECFDISSGGFSFLVSRMESKFFKIHDPIRSITLKVDDWSVTVNAEIALIKEIEPDEFNGHSYKVWRICCRFSQIDQVSKKRLERYIFERIKDELHVING